MLAFVALAAALAAAPGPLPELRPADAARVIQEVRRPGAKAVLVNLWATWCQPCREEFPDLVRIEREFRDRGLRVVFVSADFPDAERDAQRFLAAHGVRGPSFIKEGDDMTFIDGLHSAWSGALPATFIYDSNGVLREFWEGKADRTKLLESVSAALGEDAGAASRRKDP